MKKTIKNIALLAIAAITTLSFASCEKSTSDNSGELSSNEKTLKAAVVEYVPNVIYEIYGNLADYTTTLSDEVSALYKSYSKGSLTQSEINSVCTTFLNARASWESSEAFLYGAATAYGIDPHIDTWPLDKSKLSTALSDANVIADLKAEGAGAVDEVGVANLGFHGIEFILFRDGSPRTPEDFASVEDDEAFANVTVTGETELIFAAAVAEDLRNYCWELQCSWDPNAPSERVAYVEDELELNTTLDSGLTYGENLLASASAGSTFASWQKAVQTILVGGCSNICSEVANSKIASAYNHTDDDYIESPYSKNSYTDFLNNILSIQYSLYGSYKATSPSSSSLVNALTKCGYTGVSNLTSALDEAISALKACIASGVAFVDNPQSAYAGTAITKINALDDELNKAADFVGTL